MKHFIFAFFLALNFTLPLVALAQEAPRSNIIFNPAISIPESKYIAQTDVVLANNTSNLCDYIITLFKYGIGIVGVAAAIGVCIGGVLWVLSAGNSGRVSKAKGWIMDSLIGLAVALGSFLILSSINQDLVLCKAREIPLVGRQELVLPALNTGTTTVYAPEAQKSGIITKNLDNSGNFMCCVIYGHPFDVNFGMNGQYCGSRVKRCATYQSNNTGEAQRECAKFYTDFRVYDNTLKFNCPFEKMPPTTDGEEGSATIYNGGKCEGTSNPNFAEWCKGI